MLVSKRFPRQRANSGALGGAAFGPRVSCWLGWETLELADEAGSALEVGVHLRLEAFLLWEYPLFFFGESVDNLGKMKWGYS